MSLSPPFRRFNWVLLAPLFLGVPACDRSGVGTTYPVSGKVTMEKTPLTAGLVTFIPHKEKGNTSRFSPTGSIGADGTYTLTTEGKTGAPPGWYKVTVTTNVPPSGTEISKPAVTVPPKYEDAAHTPLEKEVIASPEEGRYNLDVRH
jgi:hypothetical protein